MHIFVTIGKCEKNGGGVLKRAHEKHFLVLIFILVKTSRNTMMLSLHHDGGKKEKARGEMRGARCEEGGGGRRVPNLDIREKKIDA